MLLSARLVHRLALVFWLSWPWFSAHCLVAGVVVLLHPPEAVQAGASWRTGDGPWQAPGCPTAMPAGTHEVTFRVLPGWTAPPPWPVTVEYPDRTSTILASYSKQPPDDALLHLVVNVAGTTSGRRHPLTLLALDGARDAYHPDEDIGNYLPPAQGWSEIVLEAEGAPQGLLWDARALRPETTWTIAGSLTAGDELTLDWRDATFPPGTSAWLRLAPLAPPLDMAGSRGCTLTAAGNVLIQIQVRHDHLQSMAYQLTPGWNAIGVVHQLLDTSAKRLAALKPMMAEDDAMTVAGHVPPGRACWVFTPAALRLELLGTAPDDTTADTAKHGWSFRTVFVPTTLEHGNQAWTWREHGFATEDGILVPGVGFWTFQP